MENINTQTIGSRIKLAREKIGLNQTEVSNLMNLTRGVCGQWERGLANPATAHLSRLADILGVSFEYLAKGTNAKSPKSEVVLSDKTQEKILNAKAIKLIENMPFKQKQDLVNFLNNVKY
jgi:transcriptional regulator with XRE-family HTH domain